jgi:hypothetical protein
MAVGWLSAVKRLLEEDGGAAWDGEACESSSSAAIPGPLLRLAMASLRLECRELFECAAGSECDGGEGITCDGHGEACFVAEEFGEAGEEGSAADEGDAVANEVG